MQSWIKENPELFHVILWPLVAAVVTGTYRWITGKLPDLAVKYPRFEALIAILEIGLPGVNGILAEILAVLTGTPSPMGEARVAVAETKADAATLVKLASKRPPPMAGVLFCLALAASVTAPVVLPGCAWFRANEPAVIHAEEQACEVISLVTPNPLVQPICLTVEDVTKLIGELFAARHEGRAARIRLVARDGSSQDIVIEKAQLDEQIDRAMAVHAKLKAAHK